MIIKLWNKFSNYLDKFTSEGQTIQEENDRLMSKCWRLENDLERIEKTCRDAIFQTQDMQHHLVRLSKENEALKAECMFLQRQLHPLGKQELSGEIIESDEPSVLERWLAGEEV